MSSLSAKDRVSLSQFTFSDGRRCRTPRTGKNPHFCFDHAKKEAQAHAKQELGNDLDYFFSGQYLSACDLSTALGRLILAVLRGDVKPRTARTVAYLAQTLLQTIHLAKHEYINTFGTDGWRNSIRNSVNDNYNHRFPPTPESDQPESPQPQPAPPSTPPQSTTVAHPFRGEALPSTGTTSPAPATQPAHASQPTSSPHPPLPPTSAEFAQHVLAGRNSSRSEIQTLSGPGLETASFPATPHVQPAPRNPQPASPAPQPAASTTNMPPPIPATQPAPSVARTPQPAAGTAVPPIVPVNPPQPPPSPRQSGPSRDTPWWDFGRVIPPDSHLL